MAYDCILSQAFSLLNNEFHLTSIICTRNQGDTGIGKSDFILMMKMRLGMPSNVTDFQIRPSTSGLFWYETRLGIRVFAKKLSETWKVL